VGGSCAGDSGDQGRKRALSGPASTAHHVSRWRLAARDCWLTARGPTRRGGRAPACRSSPRWRWRGMGGGALIEVLKLGRNKPKLLYPEKAFQPPIMVQ